MHCIVPSATSLLLCLAASSMADCNVVTVAGRRKERSVREKKMALKIEEKREERYVMKVMESPQKHVED